MSRTLLVGAALFLVGVGAWTVAGVPSGAASAPDPLASESEAPPEVDDRASFTVRAERIVPGPDGRICAERLGPDLNEVTIDDARLENVTLWHEGERATRAHVSRQHTDRTVLYTNGENERVTALAALGACLPIPQPKPVTVAAYYVETDAFEGSDVTVVTAPSAADDAPDPGGLDLGHLADDAAAAWSNDSDSSDGSEAAGDRSDRRRPAPTAVATPDSEESPPVAPATRTPGASTPGPTVETPTIATPPADAPTVAPFTPFGLAPGVGTETVESDRSERREEAA